MEMSRFFYESDTFTGLGFTFIFKRPGRGWGEGGRGNICCVTTTDRATSAGCAGKL